MKSLNKLKNLNIFGSNSSRSKKIQANALQMYIYRAGGIAVNFLYVPLLIDSLSRENYGIWLTITSIVGMMSFFDIGLGNGMRNKVAESLAKNDTQKAREYVSTTYIMLACIGLCLVGLILVLVPLFDWTRILNAPDANPTELTRLILFVFVFFVVQLVLHLLASLFNAMQTPAKSSMVTFFSQVSGLIVVFALSRILQTNSLLIYGFAISLSPIVVLFVFSLFFYSGSLSFVSPSVKLFKKELCKDVVNMGVQYFLIQLTAILMFQSNNFIIAHCIDVASVVDYNVAYKYVSIPLMGYTILTAPLWSATTDAYASGDYKWIKDTIRRMLKIAAIFIAFIVLLVLVSPLVYILWLGDSLSVNWGLISILALYQVFSILTALFCMIINGIGKIRLQFVICFVEAIIHIPLTIYMSSYVGLYAVAISLAIITAINAIWEPIQIKKILNNTANGIWNK